MARGRMVAKCLGSSRKFAELQKAAEGLGEFAQALYPLLVANADDFGRLSGDAFSVKYAVFPTSPRPEEDFELALRAMQLVGLIQRYTVQGDTVIQIEQWDRHQTGLHKRTESRFPEPSGTSGNVREFPSELNRTEGKGSEGNGTGADAPVARGGCLHGGSHRAHASCGKVCVPSFLHGEFRTLVALDGKEDAADAELRKHYRTWWDSLPPGQVVTDPIKWLRAKFAEQYADRAAPTTPDKRAARKAAEAAFLNRHKETA